MDKTDEVGIFSSDKLVKLIESYCDNGFLIFDTTDKKFENDLINSIKNFHYCWSPIYIKNVNGNNTNNFIIVYNYIKKKYDEPSICGNIENFIKFSEEVGINHEYFLMNSKYNIIYYKNLDGSISTEEDFNTDFVFIIYKYIKSLCKNINLYNLFTDNIPPLNFHSRIVWSGIGKIFEKNDKID